MSLKLKETITCPECGEKIDYHIWASLNGDLDPEAKQQLMDGTLFLYECPYCKKQFYISHPCLYHDMKHETMVYYVEEFAVESAKETFEGIPSDVRKRIVTDHNALREKAIIFENELDDRVIELIKLFYIAQAMEEYPDANIRKAYFLIEDGKYIVEFIADIPLNVEIDKKTYDIIRQRFADALAEDDEMCIDYDWAKRMLKM